VKKILILDLQNLIVAFFSGKTLIISQQFLIFGFFSRSLAMIFWREKDLEEVTFFVVFFLSTFQGTATFVRMPFVRI
jgi:hypothetical protein